MDIVKVSPPPFRFACVVRGADAFFFFPFLLRSPDSKGAFSTFFLFVLGEKKGRVEPPPLSFWEACHMVEDWPGRVDVFSPFFFSSISPGLDA